MTSADVIANVREHPDIVRFFSAKEQTHEVALAAVSSNGYCLKHVYKQTPEVCAAAIENAPHAIEYVKAPSHQLCMRAIELDAFCLGKIRHQTVAMCILAVTQTGWALESVNLPADRLMDPASQQMTAWLQVLQACEDSNRRSINKVHDRLLRWIPFGAKHVLEWLQPADEQRLMSDLITEVVEHARRLSGNSERIRAFCQQVLEQEEIILKEQAGRAPKHRHPDNDELEHPVL